MTKARRQVPRRVGPSLRSGKAKTDDFNIWYQKTPGRRDTEHKPATARCHIARDSGTTKASEEAYFCRYFAKGVCSLGPNCSFLHRLPTASDEAKLDLVKDIFGRDRHSTDREDMGGVGSFNRENTSLYVGGIAATASWKQMQGIARTQFGEWGPIRAIKVLPERGVVFVRYKLRCSAEFAKEAMSNQALCGNEILNVRWATEDPNPGVRRQDSLQQGQRIYDAASKALAAQHQQYTHCSRQPPISQPPAALAQYPTTDPSTDSQYPSTDAQYPSTDAQYPSTDAQYPSTDAQYPSTDSQFPSTEAQPSTGARSLALDQHPATAHQPATKTPSVINTQHSREREKPSDIDLVDDDAGVGLVAYDSSDGE